jgi:hypothetical protein
LPQVVERCQFCDANVALVYRPVDHSRHATAVHASGSVWFWYTVISVLWVLDGVYQFGSGIGLFGSTLNGISVAIGAFMTVTGLGFLSRNEVFRSHYMPLCFLALCAGVWTAVDGMRSSAVSANTAYLLCAIGAARALTAGLMSTLAGKTYTKLAR